MSNSHEPRPARLPACLTECYNLFTLTLPTFNVVAPHPRGQRKGLAAAEAVVAATAAAAVAMEAAVEETEVKGYWSGEETVISLPLFSYLSSPPPVFSLTLSISISLSLTLPLPVFLALPFSRVLSHSFCLCSRQHSRIVAGTLGLLETSVNSCGRSHSH